MFSLKQFSYSKFDFAIVPAAIHKVSTDLICKHIFKITCSRAAVGGVEFAERSRRHPPVAGYRRAGRSDQNET